MPEVAVAVAVATFTMRGTLTLAVRQQLPLELEVQKAQLQHRGQILVFTRLADQTPLLVQLSLPSVVVVAEATKEAHKMGILEDLVAVVQTNPAQPTLALVALELQGKDLQVEIHAAVAVVKSLAVAVEALVELVLMVPLVVAVVVVTDPTIRELEEMVFRTH